MRLPHLPLYVRVVIGVVLGALIGLVFGTSPIVGGITTEDFGRIGVLVVRILKMLAVPLVLFAVLDAVARTMIAPRAGVRLLVICAVNVSVAFAIGLTLMNTLHPGDTWQGHLQEIAGLSHAEMRQAPEGTSLSPLDNLMRWIPESFAQPFSENNVIAVVLIALLAGAALRSVRTSAQGHEVREVDILVDGISAGLRVLMKMLSYIIEVVPFAVFGVVAQVVGKAGLETFGVLSGFLGVILLGFAFHSLGYYPLVTWVVGRIHPRTFFGRGVTAIVTAVSMNSSLATMPITLKCLDEMGVSRHSARLSTCIGTNFNNDGIMLYEAMAAIFLAQALGYDLSLGAQMTIVLSSVMAGVGIAGIPEAGLIVLPLVLSAAGLPEPVVAALLPVIVTVDWILARARSGVNVMADMVVAILLDRWARVANDPEPAQ